MPLRSLCWTCVLIIVPAEGVGGLSPSTIALDFEVILVEGGEMTIVLAALYGQLDEFPLAAKGRIFATAFLEGLPITGIDVLIKDCVDMGELFTLEEDIRALIPGFYSVVLYLGVLRVEDVVFLTECLRAQEMVGPRGGKNAVGNFLAAHHHRGVLQEPLPLLGIHHYNYSSSYKKSRSRNQ